MSDRLHHQAVSLIVKQHVRELGLVGDFSAHCVNFQDAFGQPAQEHRRFVELRARRRCIYDHAGAGLL